MDQRTIDIAIEALKTKKHITDIESDILKTWEDYKRNPFDREKAQSRIISNNIKYPDILVAIEMMPNIVKKPFTEVTEDDTKGNLANQINCMFLKRL